MTQPKRIQRKRTKGWRMPKGCIYVGRPSKWGNPFQVDTFVTAEMAVDAFRFAMQDGCVTLKMLDANLALDSNHIWELTYHFESIHREIRKLKGKDLCCWCPLLDKDGQPYPCHADVLLEIANTGE